MTDTPATAPAQSWARISIPVSGSDSEAVSVDIAASVAAGFGAQLNFLFAPPDPAELAPWLGEGFMGTVQVAAMDGLKTAAEEAEAAAREAFDALGYDSKVFLPLKSPVWQCLAVETRLSDLVVFGDESARGRGLLSEAFQQVLMEERAGVFIARQPFDLSGPAVVAWDGKEPSSRAARRAIPLLKKASKVVIVGAPVGESPADLGKLARYYMLHGLNVEIDLLSKTNDLIGALVEANKRHGAQYMVAGAFGRSRLREFAFGGTTRALLHNTNLNLYMAH
ncbi:universal stress protein [Asticcacaulis sp. BYS171W]|uniref:Universal stress protein n=1 Tax=Asticcacaulis aquaticus TaxID=2984212 RepID=A0ABT5HWB7_9CAUL|nr:universal stress protein [Asticcacaulis aquaticus]MDC7684334.1 universal stress protein [Asticcacaulis aquaticus]